MKLPRFNVRLKNPISQVLPGGDGAEPVGIFVPAGMAGVVVNVRVDTLPPPFDGMGDSSLVANPIVSFFRVMIGDTISEDFQIEVNAHDLQWVENY